MTEEAETHMRGDWVVSVAAEGHRGIKWVVAVTPSPADGSGEREGFLPVRTLLNNKLQEWP